MDTNKLNVKKTVYFSFGFLAVSLAWSLYNAMVPQLLNQYTQSALLIGFIMVIDNIAGLALEPTFGIISDRTRTKFGRRMPYILIGLPVCAIAFCLIPFMHTLWSLVGVLVLFCVVMAIWRTPVISLMPDLTPGPLRSQANGIVNLMGGIGSLIAFAVGGTLLKLGGFPLPFFTAGGVMIVALLVLIFKVREPAHAYEPEVKQPRVKLEPAERKSLLLILGAIFFWFVGYNAVETFFTLYATHTINVSGGTATIMLGVFSIAFIAFAVPSGFIGAKIGRRKMIMIGLGGITLMFIPMIIGVGMIGTIVCLLIAGLFWACVNINSLPMVLRIGGDHVAGTFTGFYYVFSLAAQIISPLAVGAFIDFAGRHSVLGIPTDQNYRVLFIYSCVGFIISLVVLSFVRHGEDAPEQKTEAIEILGSIGD